MHLEVMSSLICEPFISSRTIIILIEEVAIIVTKNEKNDFAFTWVDFNLPKFTHWILSSCSQSFFLPVFFCDNKCSYSYQL